MYKVERKIIESGRWQEVMLSPFKTMKEVKAYYEKYSKYYPESERVYRTVKIS